MNIKTVKIPIMGVINNLIIPIIVRISTPRTPAPEKQYFNPFNIFLNITIPNSNTKYIHLLTNKLYELSNLFLLSQILQIPLKKLQQKRNLIKTL